MSINEQTPLSQPTSAVRNTLEKEQAPQDLARPISDEVLREYCDKNYHQILPIIAEKVHQEKVQQEKLKAVKARLNFEETSQHSGSETPSKRMSLKERLGHRRAHNTSGSPKPRRGRSKSPRDKDPERRTRNRIGSKKQRNKRESLRRMKALSESEGSVGRHWKSKLNKQKSSVEDDLSQPWVCEETDPFTPRIRYFDFPKTRMPSHIKTYEGSEDPEDHLKIFQAAAKTERLAMPTYDDLKNAFVENNPQQKKCIKDPVEIHNIKQRDKESTEERNGTFLGYKVDADELRVCPDKVEAVLSLPSPRCIKDVQKLNGKLASLNRFLSRSAEKSLPFFKTLKRCTKKNDFQWTTEAETTFKQMKQLIAELPMLTAPKEKEDLIMYLAAVE
uniref:Reverse transcriptase domain-containing protein n=1 Tax=Tanacetum cinerariifolium TaxID=118510 RepID=A0A6L2J6J2_TANCI|nr:reverse transcriptase domain-containing protein [Tanacetum cinerariifolium]